MEYYGIPIPLLKQNGNQGCQTRFTELKHTYPNLSLFYIVSNQSWSKYVEPHQSVHKIGITDDITGKRFRSYNGCNLTPIEIEFLCICSNGYQVEESIKRYLQQDRCKFKPKSQEWVYSKLETCIQFLQQHLQLDQVEFTNFGFPLYHYHDFTPIHDSILDEPCIQLNQRISLQQQIWINLGRWRLHWPKHTFRMVHIHETSFTNIVDIDFQVLDNDFWNDGDRDMHIQSVLEAVDDEIGSRNNESSLDVSSLDVSPSDSICIQTNDHKSVYLRDSNAPKYMVWSQDEELALINAVSSVPINIQIPWFELFEQHKSHFQPFRRPCDLSNKWKYMKQHCRQKIQEFIPHAAHALWFQFNPRPEKRKLDELNANEIWTCMMSNCGKKYCKTSTVSIDEHKARHLLVKPSKYD